jgi:large subunit ribosomal protein L7A
MVTEGKGAQEVLEVLKGSNKAIGIKQTLKAVENKTAVKVFIAKDADEKITANLKELCHANGIEIVYVDTMKQLGKAVGIEVGASTACVLR